MSIQIEEVGLREGLQSNSKILKLKEKIILIDQILASGINRVQLGSFINEKKMPQMAGVEDLFKHYSDREDIQFSGLVLNIRGLERALNCGVKLLNISISASNTHNIENTGKSITEGLPTIINMIQDAVQSGVKVRAGIQAAFGCHFEGSIALPQILLLTEKFLDAGATEIGLSDTSGFATPGLISKVCSEVNKITGNATLGLHLHDTFGMGLANVLAAIDTGVTLFDSSVAGMGGCPFMPKAPGNLPTEDLVYMLQSMSLLKNICISDIVTAAQTARMLFEKPFTGVISTHYNLLSKLKLV